MKYSKLKHDLEVLELNHKHEVQLLNMKHEQDRSMLKSKCTHNYEDGSSAKEGNGVQWDMYYKCEICGKSL
jgi:hypothetical protein